MYHKRHRYRVCVFASIFTALFVLSVNLSTERIQLLIHSLVESNITKGQVNNAEVELQYCNCTRNGFNDKRDNNAISKYSTGGPKFEDTTCGLDSYRRGSGQKVVAFSFYGDMSDSRAMRQGYFEGIKENVDLIYIFYPGWTMRLYYDLEYKDPMFGELCSLACSRPILDLCHVRHLPGSPSTDASRIFPMLWRYFPTLDPQVDVFASRDLDSRITAREVAAVKEWIENSTQPIHIMRDNPAHGQVMLGGLWDANMTRKQARHQWKYIWKRIINDPLLFTWRLGRGQDQIILARHVWKCFGREMSLQHDSYLCEHYKGSVGWPTQRLLEPNNFVGSVANGNSTLEKECPIQCRKNEVWKYC